MFETTCCVHSVADGCGTYCKAIDMKQLKDSGRLDETYPHKYWRIDCYGKLIMCPFKSLYGG